MTIAAGFLTTEGILLCADTQYSGGMKVDRTKIFPSRYGNDATVAFALAGSEAYGKMAIQDCQRAISRIRPDVFTLESIYESIRATITQIHERYVDTRPEAERGGARFELLIAVSHRIEGLHLYVNRHTALSEVDSHECVGIGEYLAGYLIGSHIKASMGQTLILAGQMLGALKCYDANCGGFSQHLILRMDGTVGVLPEFWGMVSEACIFEYESAIRRLLQYTFDGDIPSEDFEKALNAFPDAVRGIRNRWGQRLAECAANQALMQMISTQEVENLRKLPPYG